MTENPAFPGYDHLRHTATKIYDSIGKGWYFRLDDDNKMSYNYILSITSIWMGQCDTYNHTCCRLLSVDMFFL